MSQTSLTRYVIIDDIQPYVPSALPDGLIPIAALVPSLRIRAPLVKEPGYVTREGDIFELLINGNPVEDSRTTYIPNGDDHVDLYLPVSLSSTLADGSHALSYRVVVFPSGDAIQSNTTIIQLDRVPVGGRLMPSIRFDEEIVVDGLSLTTLLSLPGSSLLAEIPDYAGIHPLDTIQVFMSARDSGVELHVATLKATTDGTPMVVSIDRTTLEKIEGAGRVDFYYQVLDAVGLKSPMSSSTPLSVSIKGSPVAVPAPMVLGAADGLVTDKDVRPVLLVQIPALNPPIKAGDTLQLFVGSKALPAFEVDQRDAGDAPIPPISIEYTALRRLVDIAEEPPFNVSFRYIHRRAGVASRSDHATHLLDLTLPGGWDPMPETPENEALPKPVLHSASGSQDNYIGFEDAEFDAFVTLGPSTHRSSRAVGLEVDDVVTVLFEGSAVGVPLRISEPDAPLSIIVPSADLKANAGSVNMTLEIERPLSVSPHVSIATSPSQRIRIDSTDGLPGAGKPLRAAVFPDAVRLESDTGTYAVYEGDLVKGFTPIRIYGYTNMQVGDLLDFFYDGFDGFDGGKNVPPASGSIRHEIVDADLIPKDDDLLTPPSKEVFIDIRMESSVVYTLAFGRFESFYTVKNSVGQAKTTSRIVLVSARVPKPIGE